MAVALSGASRRLMVPPGACDCHMHVFGGPDRYSLPKMRSYTPQEATLASWRAMATPLGLERVVVVQPSVYGTDNTCTVDALRALGASARGIAQIDSNTSDATLAELQEAGVRGVRLNPKSVGQRDLDAVRALLDATAGRIAPLGWHIQIYGSLTMLSEIAGAIRAAPVPVVLDHMGGATVGDEHGALRPVLDLLGEGRCWVKLSGAYRVSRLESGFRDATPVARALVHANPDHIVWGSDWPHTAHHSGTPQRNAPPIAFRTLDAAELLARLGDAAGDDATFARILSINPARLYGF